MGVEADGKAASVGEVGEAAADFERVGDLAPEVVGEDGEVLSRAGFEEHLGGTDGAAGVADEGMRHGAAARGLAELAGAKGGAAADETDGAFALGRAPADGGGVGHEGLHLGAGAVPGFHGKKGGARQGEAHLIGVVGGDAGGTELLQQDGLGFRKGMQAAGDQRDRLAGADPFAFRVTDGVGEGRGMGLRDGVEPLDHGPRGGDDGTAEEHGVGNGGVAEAVDHLAGASEVGVGPCANVVDNGAGHRALAPVMSCRQGRHSSGRLSAQGQAASNPAAACSTPKSSSRRPTICSPTGNPAAVNPHGTEAAGLCDALKG